MIKITRETDYGILLMSALATLSNAESASALAKRCGLPLPITGKILKILTQSGLLESRRGAHGGYVLSQPPAEITMAAIIEAIEGPIALTACTIEDDNTCAYLDHCHVSSHWNRINAAIRDALDGISLVALADPRPDRHTKSTSDLAAVTATIEPTEITLNRASPHSSRSVRPTSKKLLSKVFDYDG